MFLVHSNCEAYQLEGCASDRVHGVSVQVVAAQALQIELQAAQRRDGG